MKLEEAREGADVISADGERLGKLSRVVVKEETLEITQLVVDVGHALLAGAPNERLIPVGMLEDESGGAIHVTMKAAEFRELSVNYDTIEWRLNPSLAAAIVNSMPGGTGAYVPFDVMAKEADEVDIKEGSPVWRMRPHQKIGEVERVLFNEETLKVQALVIRRGHFFSHEAVLPSRYIVEVIEILQGVVRVQMTDEELAGLAAYGGSGS